MHYGKGIDPLWKFFLRLHPSSLLLCRGLPAHPHGFVPLRPTPSSSHPRARPTVTDTDEEAMTPSSAHRVGESASRGKEMRSRRSQGYATAVDGGACTPSHMTSSILLRRTKLP
jgi:hypothetical protein